MDKEGPKKAINLLILGQSKAGKTTLAKSFAHHFLSKAFEEERLELISSNNINHNHQKLSVYHLENETTRLTMVDTIGPLPSGDINEEMGSILDDIILKLTDLSFINGVILVINPSSRKDSLLETYLSRVMKILPDDIRRSFYIICSKNVGKVQQEIREIICEMLAFNPEINHWFSLDNKCILPLSEIDDEYQELFKMYWKAGKKAFNTINDNMLLMEPISTKTLKKYRDYKANLELLLEELAIKRKELFSRIEFEVDVQTNDVAKTQPKKQKCEVGNNHTWSCKGCKQICAQRKWYTRFLKNFAISPIFLRIFLWILPNRLLTWIFGCRGCKCSLAKHMELREEGPEKESLVPQVLIAREEKKIDISSMVKNHLASSLKKINGLLKSCDSTNLSDYLYDYYIKHFNQNYVAANVIQASKSVQKMLYEALNYEKMYYSSLQANSSM